MERSHTAIRAALYICGGRAQGFSGQDGRIRAGPRTVLLPRFVDYLLHLNEVMFYASGVQ